MMRSSEVLELEIRLLLVKYKREAVLQALAQALNETVEEIESALRRLETIPTKKPKSLSGTRSEEEAALAARPELARLVSLYDTKLFLPSLKDVSEFLAARGERTTPVRSRAGVRSRVLHALKQYTDAELASLGASRTSSRDRGSYAALAAELMNPRQSK